MGGIASPISVIAQFTFLLSIRRLDEILTQRELQTMLIETPLDNLLIGFNNFPNFAFNK